MSVIKLGFSERLKEEKLFGPEQADAFARVLNDELSDKLATKADLAELENSMQARMTQLENSMQIKMMQMENSMQVMQGKMMQMESSMQVKMMQMENRIIKWMVGLVLASAAINVTVTGFLVTL